MYRNNHVTKKKACMLAYAFYENDNRIKRYVDTLYRNGWTVDVIALRRPNMSDSQKIESGTLYRIQERIRNEKGKLSYILRMMVFFMRSFLFISRKHIRERYALVHVHTPPDFEIFSAFVPKIMGSRLVLDIHDIMPEFFMSKFNPISRSPIFKILLLMEKMSASFAHHVIVANDIWKEKLIKRSVAESHCSTILNYVDRKVFTEPNEKPADGTRLVMLYPGGLQWHQGLDIAIHAFANIKDIEKQIDFHIVGEGNEKERLVHLVKKLNLEDRILFFDPVAFEEIPKLMASAHIGIVAKRAEGFGNEAYSTKIMEFMSQGIPVILSRTKVDTFYFTEKEVCFFDSGDVQDLARAIIKVARDIPYRTMLIKNSLRYVKENSWENKENLYLSIVNNDIKMARSNTQNIISINNVKKD